MKTLAVLKALAKSPEVWRLIVIILSTAGLTGGAHMVDQMSPHIVGLLGLLLG